MVDLQKDEIQQNAPGEENSADVNKDSLEDNAAASATQEQPACASPEVTEKANGSCKQLETRIENVCQQSETEQIRADIESSGLPEEKKNELSQRLRKRASELEVRDIVSRISLDGYPYTSSEEYQQIKDSTVLDEDGKKFISALVWELDSKYLANMIKKASFPDEEKDVLDTIKSSTLPEDSTTFRPEPEQLERVLKEADCAEEVNAILQRLKATLCIEIPGQEALRKLVLKKAHPDEYKKQAIKETLKSVFWGLVYIKIVCWIGKALLRWAAKLLISTYTWLIGADELYKFLDKFGAGDVMADELIGQVGFLTWHWFYILSFIMIVVYGLKLVDDLKEQ